MAPVSDLAVGDALKGLSLKDLRSQCRARGINPAGSQDSLKQRLSDEMHASGNLAMLTLSDGGADIQDDQMSKNNYQRPGGNQNVGNRISNRPTSRVLAPPGGSSQICFGDHQLPHQNAPPGRRGAHQVLEHMGLGDTDDIVARGGGMAPQESPRTAAGRMSDMSDVATMSSAARLFNMDSEGAILPSPAHASRAMSKGAMSQVAFGEYQLPTSAHNGPAHGNMKPFGEMPQDGLVRAVDSFVKSLTLSELRTNCRDNGLSPAGGLEQLRDRLGSHMVGTGIMPGGVHGVAAGGGNSYPADFSHERGNRSGAHPGGQSQITFGNEGHVDGRQANNYSRPSGNQNMGNFLTDRPSSRVLAPPGGRSQVTFG